MLKKIRRNKKGFTLVELMTVVIIIGILASISIPIYRAQVKKAMAAEGAALLGSVLTAEKVYYAEHNTYTTTKADIGVDPTGNKYFTDYTVSSADDNGFTATTTYTDTDGKKITVTMTYTNAAGANIEYSL